MDKKLKIAGIVAGLIILLVTLVASSIFVSTGSANTNPDDVTGISQYSVHRDENLYNIRFSLTDKDSLWVISNASVEFVVKDDDGGILYSENFDIKSEDYKTFQMVLSGMPVIAYSWNIDGAKLNRGSLDFHIAYLTVTLPNAKSFTAETPVL